MKILVFIIFILIIIFFSIPFLWLYLSAFDKEASAFIKLPNFTLSNFIEAFKEYNFTRYLINSSFVATITMLLTVLIVAISAYSISRIKWRYKNSLLYSLLLLHSIPLSTTMVPIYGIMRTLHLRNSYLGLILVYTAMQLPFLIWLMKGFFDTIPEELEEASWIDGCTSLKALFKVILPISLPGILVVSALSFLGAWGESMLILILVDSEKMKTVPLVFYEAIRTVGGYMEVRYELVSSFAILFQIPVVILFILSRKLLATSIVPGVER